MQLATFQRVALEATSNTELQAVLDAIVDGLSADPGVALARLWLLAPGDLCSVCRMRPECPDQRRCLHLKASAGASRAQPGVRWSGTDGAFRRFPVGVRKVGKVAGSGSPEFRVVAAEEGPEESWLVHPGWAGAEGITCFAAQPLIFRGDILGTLAVFCREELDAEQRSWLRVFADQAAVAIASARAFEEVQVLRERLELERDYLRDELREVQHPSGILGESPALRHALDAVARVAPSDASVLVLGETGTGKELVAMAIHDASARHDAPLVRVNCAATPAELFESEFFGHQKGSFTGATGDHSGRFEVADGGTIFLDEVGEIPLSLQGKLLRVLQEGQFTRVGEERERRVDVRVIAATNRDLAKDAREGRFREDLYYRLAVVTIDLPPLREREGDVARLASHFLEEFAIRHGARGLRLRPGDIEALEAYEWPGNVRELRNVIERAVLLAEDGRLQMDFGAGRRPTPSSGAAVEPAPFDTESERLARMRRDILAALERTGGKVSGEGGAAELLGIKPTTLASRMRSLRIRRRFQ